MPATRSGRFSWLTSRPHPEIRSAVKTAETTPTRPNVIGLRSLQFDRRSDAPNVLRLPRIPQTLGKARRNRLLLRRPGSDHKRSVSTTAQPVQQQPSQEAGKNPAPATNAPARESQHCPQFPLLASRPPRSGPHGHWPHIAAFRGPAQAVPTPGVARGSWGASLPATVAKMPQRADFRAPAANILLLLGVVLGVLVTDICAGHGLGASVAKPVKARKGDQQPA